MQYLDLITQQAQVAIQEAKAQLHATELIWRWAFILYVVGSLANLKRRVHRLVKAIPEPAPEPDDQFIRVTEDEIKRFKGDPSAYDVPREFPRELEKYVVKPTPADFSIWILELGSMDEKSMLDVKRAITAAAAFHNQRIPKLLRLLDSRTRALWVRLGFDMELRGVDIHQLRQEVTARSVNGAEPSYDVEMVRQLLPLVGESIITHAEDQFPCLSIFAGNLTRHRDLSVGLSLTLLGRPSVVQSLATAYAVKSGFTIPASYVRCDSLALQLAEYE